MLARVAENIYWLSRYLERAENTARLISYHSNLLMDLPAINDHEGWMPLISINGLDKEFSARHNSASEDTVNYFLLADEQNAGSLINAFKAIHINLRSCRDVIPKVSYEAINGLCRHVIKHIGADYLRPADRAEALHKIENGLLAISSSLNNNMCHDLGYLIMRMGCYLERADMTSRIIDVQSTRLSAANSAPELLAMQAQRWVSVLRSVAAHQMYRQHIKRPVTGEDTLTFLLLNKHLPRSYTFCLDHLDACVNKLENPESTLKAIAGLKAMLTSGSMIELATDPASLHLYLDQLQLGMLDVNAAISASYFPTQEVVE